MKSSLNDFIVLCLLLFLGASLSSSSGISVWFHSGCSNGTEGSGVISDLYLDDFGISFIGKISTKKVASYDSIIVPTFMSGTSDFTTTNL